MTVAFRVTRFRDPLGHPLKRGVGLVSLMHDILEARCPACGFSMKGLADAAGLPESTCPFCDLPFSVRSNLNVSRQLPLGLGLLMGAFVASADASPLLANDAPLVPSFARAFRPSR